MSVRSISSVNQDLTWSDVPLEDRCPDEELEALMRTSYQSGPVDASDSLCRTEYRAVAVLHAPSGDVQIPEVQLASPPTTIQAPCPAASCQWRDEGAATICGETISCKDVAQHLRVHGVKDIHRGDYVVCNWEGCSAPIKRNNIARHICEGHLGHHRDKGHSS